MAMIHVNRAGTSLGTFSEEEVREGLRTGRFLGTDLAWREGMPSWQALSQFTEFAAAGPPPSPGPAARPSAPITPAVQLPTGPRSGLPWEHRNVLGFFPAFFRTVGMVLTKPADAFTVMKTEGGLADPLIYVLIGGSAGWVIMTLLSMITNSMHLTIGNRTGALGALTGAGASGVMGLIQLILAPLWVTIAAFVGAGIVHLCLMLVGGAKKSFETTFRANSYAWGSAYLLAMIPCCGGIIALIWGLVVNAIGLARSHETDTGRAVIAVLIPVVVGCGCAILFSVIVFGSFAALMQQQQH